MLCWSVLNLVRVSFRVASSWPFLMLNDCIVCLCTESCGLLILRHAALKPCSLYLYARTRLLCSRVSLILESYF